MSDTPRDPSEAPEGPEAHAPARKSLTAPRAPRWLVVTIFLILIASGILIALQYGGGVSEFVQYDREEGQLVVHGEMCRGWRYRPRGAPPTDDPVRMRLWSPSSGYLVLESETLADERTRTTIWTADGKVFQQTEFKFGGVSSSQLEPPWLWGVKDQTAPSMPEELRLQEN